MDARDPASIAFNVAKLRRAIRLESVSMVHVRSRAPAFSAWAAARAERVPMVATYHGIYAARSPLKRWYNSIMTRGDLVLAGSRVVADHIASEHGLAADRIVLAQEGVDADAFDPDQVSPARVTAVRRSWGIEPGDTRQVLLLAGRLTALKGHELAIEALARLRRRDTLLVLAGRLGNPGYEGRLREAARTNGLADQVILPGPSTDMPAAYRAADFILAPSIAPESFGRTVAEAGASARPVIASHHGGPAEIVENAVTGWLVTPADPSAWASALSTALETGASVREQMGAAGRARVERSYSLERMCEATFDAYLRVLRSRT